jgi:methanogenic corrinoid protein MtbC1
MKEENNKPVNMLLESLLSGDRKKAQEICEGFLKNGSSIIELYEHLIKPVLYEVGKLWEQNKITVATEHLATAITEGILNSLYTDIIPEIYNGKKVVIACVDKEEHQVGIKMVADIFEINQWESFFLGAGIPVSELIKFIHEVKPEIIAISLSVYFNFNNLNKMLNELRASFPDTKIIVGGQALNYIADSKFKEWTDVTFIHDLNRLEEFIENYK